MLIEPNSKLLIIGDSITDCERKRPFGDSEKDGTLGDGYVSLAHALLFVAYPGHHLHIINTGVNGDRVLDLQARWEKDVLAHRPDWLAVMIGINDVWRRFGAPSERRYHVPLDDYSATLEKLVAQTRPLLKGLVLLSPYFIEPDRSDPMRAMMDQYGAAVQSIAGRHQAIFVDTQRAFDDLLRHVPSSALADDRVHPNQAGHMAIARAFVAALE